MRVDEVSGGLLMPPHMERCADEYAVDAAPIDGLSLGRGHVDRLTVETVFMKHRGEANRDERRLPFAGREEHGHLAADGFCKCVCHADDEGKSRACECCGMALKIRSLCRRHALNREISRAGWEYHPPSLATFVRAPARQALPACYNQRSVHPPCRRSSVGRAADS